MSIFAKSNTKQFYSLIALLGFAFLLFYELDLNIICYLQEIIPNKISAGFHSIGGINEVIALHIISLFHFEVLAYAVLLLLTALFFISVQLLFKAYANHSFTSASVFIICISLLIPLFDYNYPLKITFSIIFSIFLLTIANLFSEKTGKYKIALILISLVLIYYLFGLPGFYFSSIITIAHKSTLNKYKVVYALALLAIPSISFIAGINYSFQQVYFGPFISTIYESVKPIVFSIYIVAPLLLILLQTTENKTYWKSLSPQKQGLFTTLQYILLIILASGIFYFSLDNTNKKIYKIESLAQQKKWEEILQIAEQLPETGHPMVQFNINRAIYSKGHFLDELFMYPQLYGIDALFLEYASNGTLAQAKADLYFDMGYCNESKHWANESLTARGNKPHTLKCLIINYAAANQFNIAKRYWNILNRSVAHKKWAQANAGILLGESNDDIDRLQKNFPEDDFFAGIGKPQNKLEDFYASNPENKMVFEYLIANYLLIHNIGKIANEIETFKKLGYNDLPRPVEEALLVYSVQKNVDKLDLLNYKIDEKTQQDFKNFSIIMQNAGSKEKAKPVLMSFSQTYWYYLIFDSKYQKQSNS